MFSNPLIRSNQLRNVFVSALALALFGCAQKDPESTVLFVQQGDGEGGITFLENEGTWSAVLTLRGVDHTLVFADRPERSSSYLENGSFLRVAWDTSNQSSFAYDPPNAVLDYVDQADHTKQLVLVLLGGYQVRPGTVEYQITALDGGVEALANQMGVVLQAGDAPPTVALRLPSLFIDSWFSDAWDAVADTAATVAKDVAHVAEETWDTVTSCTGLLTTSCTILVMADPEADVAAAVLAAASTAAKGTAVVAFCDATGALIHDIDDRVDEVEFDNVCQTGVRSAINIIAETCHIIANLACTGEPG